MTTREEQRSEVLDELADDCREFLQVAWADESKLHSLLTCIRLHIEEYESVSEEVVR